MAISGKSTTTKPLLADPICGECGYALKGLTDSARCPECGRPIVETLVRTGMAGLNGVRYNSQTTFLGLPLISIANGPTAEEKYGHARGIIAIGDVATGVIAIGGLARGGICLGGCSIGVFAVGGCSIGVAVIGGLGIGLAALGGVAVGAYAFGGGVLYFIRGSGAVRVPLPWFW